MSRQVEGWGHQLGPGVSRLAAPAGVLKRALGRGGGGAQLGGATTCCAFPQFRSVLGVEGPPNAESRSTLEVAGRPPTTAPATGSGLGVEVGSPKAVPASRKGDAAPAMLGVPKRAVHQMVRLLEVRKLGVERGPKCCACFSPDREGPKCRACPSALEGDGAHQMLRLLRGWRGATRREEAGGGWREEAEGRRAGDGRGDGRGRRRMGTDAKQRK